MRRTAKIANSRIPLRKSVTSASASARRSFPAWIDAGEATAPFAATRMAVPRVRDGLVLRTVVTREAGARRGAHGGAR